MATVVEPPISDAELEALALAAPLEPDLGPDAVAWRPSEDAAGLLPDWYMPAPLALRRDWRARVAAAVVVAAILAINAAGLCVTYGRVTFG